MNRGQSMEPVVQIDDLSREYEGKIALTNVSLQAPRGAVLGLVGENGAGKTTLIRHILGLLAAQRGAVRVFGLDPVRNPVAVLGRIGYVSEDRDLPAWMRIDELLRYSRAFYPAWDPRYAEELRRDFGLEPSAAIKNLSRGEKARAALLVALAHRPELLVLDEPSSGLDPIVRQDILEAIIRTVSEEGRTVLFSSHLLHEVERVCDSVAMMARGRIFVSGGLEAILAAHRRVVFRLAQAVPKPPTLAGALSIRGSDRDWSCVCNGGIEQLKAGVESLGGELMEVGPVSLEDIFISRAGAEAHP